MPRHEDAYEVVQQGCQVMLPECYFFNPILNPQAQVSIFCSVVGVGDLCLKASFAKCYQRQNLRGLFSRLDGKPLFIIEGAWPQPQLNQNVQNK
eukprot:scaffold9576_cov151-Skeletonema_marinoi.AAC.2